MRCCDAAGLCRLDEVFLEGGVRDPLYAARRSATTIVAFACERADPECFCTAVGGSPMGSEGVDLLVVPLGADWLLTPVTDKGRALADEGWREACAWIAENTPPEARFITPRTQQTFKWYAGRSEVCSWKDVPQNAESVVQWWQRQHEVYPRRIIRGGLAAHGEQRLEELARKYDAQYIMIDRHTSPRSLLLPRVYPTGFEMARPTYEIYRVPRVDQ